MSHFLKKAIVSTREKKLDFCGTDGLTDLDSLLEEGGQAQLGGELLQKVVVV